MKSLFFFVVGILATVAFFIFHDELFLAAESVQEAAQGRFCK